MDTVKFFKTKNIINDFIGKYNQEAIIKITPRYHLQDILEWDLSWISEFKIYQ